MHGNIIADTHDTAAGVILHHEVDIGDAAAQRFGVNTPLPDRQGVQALQGCHHRPFPQSLGELGGMARALSNDLWEFVGNVGLAVGFWEIPCKTAVTSTGKSHMPPPNPRDREILAALTETGAARVQDLARKLRVTEETIRRAVKRLEAEGLATRVHGGVQLRDWQSEPNFAQRFAVNALAKRRIAAHLAGMIGDGSSVFLDVGSTTAYVAQALRQHRDLLVVTNSLAVAQALAARNGNRVFMAGGELRSHDGGAFGAEALAFVRQFQLRYALLSITAIDAQAGFLLQDLREAEFSRALISRAEETIVAADASKFARTAPIRLAAPEAVHGLITDAAPPAPVAALLAAAGVTVTLVG